MSEENPTFNLTGDTVETQTPPDEESVTTETRVNQKERYAPTRLDPARRQPGPHSSYLDEVQRREVEVERAKVEGREPDLKNPPAFAGTPLLKPSEINHPLGTLNTTGVEPDAVI